MTAYADYDYAVSYYGVPYVVTSCDRDLDGAVDLAAFNLLCTQATARINGYIAGRVTLPLDPVPELLRMLCVDLAIYAGCPTADVLTNQKEARHEQALKDLHLIASGKLRLVKDPDGAPLVGEAVQPLRASVETEARRGVYLDQTTREFSRTRTGIL